MTAELINLADFRRQKEERTDNNNNTQDDATLPEFLQGGIEDGEEWFLTNTETGRRARFINADELEEVEEAKVLDLFNLED